MAQIRQVVSYMPDRGWVIVDPGLANFLIDEDERIASETMPRVLGQDGNLVEIE